MAIQSWLGKMPTHCASTETSEKDIDFRRRIRQKRGCSHATAS